MAKKQAVKPKAPQVQPNGLPVGLKPEDIKPVEAPIFGTSGVLIQGTGNEFTLVFTRARPAMLVSTGAPAPVAIGEAVAILFMSPQTLKDVSIVIAEQVAAYEELSGPIVTPFVRSREPAKTRH